MPQSCCTFALRVAGILTVALGLGHMGFHRLFGWKRDFLRLTPLNTKVVTTLHVAVILLFLGLGALTIRYAPALAEPAELPSAICLTLSTFWGWRLVWQLLYFRPSKIEHDRRFLALHVLLVVLFALLTAGYAAPLTAHLKG